MHISKDIKNNQIESVDIWAKVYAYESQLTVDKQVVKIYAYFVCLIWIKNMYISNVLLLRNKW